MPLYKTPMSPERQISDIERAHLLDEMNRSIDEIAGRLSRDGKIGTNGDKITILMSPDGLVRMEIQTSIRNILTGRETIGSTNIMQNPDGSFVVSSENSSIKNRKQNAPNIKTVLCEAPNATTPLQIVNRDNNRVDQREKLLAEKTVAEILAWAWRNFKIRAH